MSRREESMRRHPSYQRRLIADAQRQLAADIEGRRRVDLELFMGGPMVPESAEVAEERMNREACEVGSSNAAPRPEPTYSSGVWRAIGAGLTVYAGIFGLLVGPDLVAGWFL